MASGTTVFQTNVTATPPNGLPIMADSVNDTDHGVGTAQYIKIMDGRTAGTIKAAVTANGIEADVTRIQGTVQTLGSVQGVGTFQVLGSVQGVGTFQSLGTFQPLAGSVHLASGTVQVLGSVQTVGTSQALGTFQTFGTVPIGTIAGTVSILGTTQPLAGSVHIASTIPGTVQVLGSVQGVGTFQVLGSVQTVGTSQALGTFQPLAGSVHLANTFPGGTIHIGTVAGTVSVGTVGLVVGTINIGTFQGTAHIGSVQRLTGGTLDFIGGTVAVGTVRQLLGTILTRPNQAVGEGFFGTRFTAGVTNGTLVPAPAAGTYVRVWDVMVSGSAAGTAFLELGDGTIFQPVYLAANGGYVMSSAKGIRTNGTAQDVLFTSGAGSWSVSISYTLENA